MLPCLGGDYEPLIRRATENWQALEKDSGRRIAMTFTFAPVVIVGYGWPWIP